MAMTLTDQAQSLAQAPMSQEDLARKNEMRDAWKAYRAKFPKPLKVARDQPDDNVRMNKCAPIVDKGVSFLFGQPVKITCDDPDDQNFLDGFWGDDDDKMTLLAKIAMNGAICSQAFVKLIPAKGTKKYPRIVNLDPMVMRIITDPEDCEIILAFVIEYPVSGGIQKRQIIARVDPDQGVELWGGNDPEDTWTITSYQRRVSERGGGSTFAQTVWQQVGEPEEWPYPFAPIFTCQNLPNPNEPWGLSDLPENIIELNKSLNFTNSNTSRIIKYHASPKTVAKGIRASQIQVAVDEVIVLESPDADIKTLEMTSNLESSRAFAGDIRTAMNEQSRVPGIALGTDEPKGNVSGVALKQYYQPLLEKTTEKQRLYGKLIREVSRAALVLAGKIPPEQFEDYKIELHWPPLLPEDDLAAAQTALIFKQIGVSDGTIMSGLGLDPDQEAEKSAKEDAKKLANFQKGQGMAPPMQAQPGQPMPPQTSPPGQSPATQNSSAPGGQQ